MASVRIAASVNDGVRRNWRSAKTMSRQNDSTTGNPRASRADSLTRSTLAELASRPDARFASPATSARPELGGKHLEMAFDLFGQRRVLLRTASRSTAAWRTSVRTTSRRVLQQTIDDRHGSRPGLDFSSQLLSSGSG